MQPDCDATFWYVPPGQLVQPVADAAENFPVGQAVYVAAFATQ